MQGVKLPYGYKFKNNEIMINPKEAVVVESIYNIRANGHTFQKVADRINANKHTTRRKLQFHPTQVWRILNNPIYLGNKTYPRIIDNELWETAQAVKTI